LSAQCTVWTMLLVTCISDYSQGFRLDLFAPYTHNSGLQEITAILLTYEFTVHRYTCTRVSVVTSRILATDLW
jgi:hypothetical protein